jgi:ATP-dependent helicase/nuclease subunit A
LSWAYPFEAATHQPAKTSVTLLRRAARQAADEVFGETEAWPPAAAAPAPSPPAPPSRASRSEASGAGIGNAHHAFLELVRLERTAGLEDLKLEAQRLVELGCLRAEDATLLDFPALAAFWESDLGARIRSQASSVRRELAFTARFSPAELAVLTGEPLAPGLEDDFVVVQGAVDLAVILPGEIWIVDFKTDRVAPGPDALAAKTKLYAPQLKLYALALSRIHHRPVSAAWIYFLARSAAVPLNL